jgi:hypothetical protein
MEDPKKGPVASTEGERDDRPGSAGDDSGDDEGVRPGSPLADDGDGPIPTLREVLECQISSWYPRFYNVGETPSSGARGADPKRPKGERRSKLTVQTVVVDLPPGFVSRLRGDGGGGAGTVRLPPGATTSSILRTSPRGRLRVVRDGGGGDGYDEGDDSDDDEDDDDDWSSSGASVGEAEPKTSPATNDGGEGGGPDRPGAGTDDPSFPKALDDAIRSGIRELGGSVVPKTNWSAPKDATWMNGGSLRCQTPGDVYLLLQSSDFCSYDLDHALRDVRDPVPEDRLASAGFGGYRLALRRWCSLHPSHEFRCFVRDHRLVGISQRHSTCYYPHLVGEKSKYRRLLSKFFEARVRGAFAGGDVPNYVWDAYVDRRDRAWILDFNAWARRTDPLLFAWDELVAATEGEASPRLEPSGDSNDEFAEDGEAGSADDDDASSSSSSQSSSSSHRRTRKSLSRSSQPEMRVVETPKQIRHDPLASYRAPIDAVHVASILSGGQGGASGEENDHDAEAFRKFMNLCRPPTQLGAQAETESGE